MPQPRLVAILTALLLLSGGRAAQAGFTYEQLVEVDRLVAAKNYSGLRSFLQANPEVLIGDEPLANELRLFLLRINSGQMTAVDLPLFSDRSDPELGSLPIGDIDDTLGPVAPPTATPTPSSPGPALPY